MQLEKYYTVRPICDLKDMLAQSCSLFGDKAAFLVKNGENGCQEISYRRFSRDVEALGTALLHKGLENHFIAVLGENRYEWCMTYLAIANGVGTVVPLDKELPVGEIENLLSRCQASTLVFSGKYRSQVKKLIGRVSSIRYFIDMDLKEDEEGLLSFERLVEEGRNLIKGGDTRFSQAEVDPDSMRVLIFTSGTTDLAKGVMLSHRNICTNLTSVCSTVLITEKDTSLSILPLHHTYECTLGFMGLIYNGGTIAFNEGLKHISRNLKEFRPTVLVTVPLLLENMHRKIWEQAGKKKIVKFKLKAALVVTNWLFQALGIDVRRKVFKAIHENFGGEMRLILTGAAAVKPEISKCFRRLGIPVLQGYGLTECAPLVAGNRDREFLDGAAGLPIPGVEVRIMNPDRKGIGEIVTKGDNVMLGYYQNDGATEKCIRDGWFYTGDLGYLDKKGFLFITGRSKNVIVMKNGKNIFPEEVETYINRSPFVQESLVWGKYDKTSGETQVCAQIFPNLDAIREKLKVIQVSKQEMMKLLNDAVKSANREMPLYKHIQQFTIREKEFTKTTTQKIKRYMEEPI